MDCKQENFSSSHEIYILCLLYQQYEYRNTENFSKQMDNLETLSDEELRLRLLQYGFPNLPVTASTRRILIKKLRNCITKERGKVRNDTSLATSFSSEDESDTDSSRKRRSTTSKSSPIHPHTQKKDGFAMPSPVLISPRPRYSQQQNIHVSPLILGDSDEESDSFNGFVKNSSVSSNSSSDEGSRYGLRAGETTNGYESTSVADLRKRLMMIRNETINNTRKTMNGPCVSTG